MDIAAWLRDLGLERYEQPFRDNAMHPPIQRSRSMNPGCPAMRTSPLQLATGSPQSRIGGVGCVGANEKRPRVREWTFGRLLLELFRPVSRPLDSTVIPWRRREREGSTCERRQPHWIGGVLFGCGGMQPPLPNIRRVAPSAPTSLPGGRADLPYVSLDRPLLTRSGQEREEVASGLMAFDPPLC